MKYIHILLYFLVFSFTVAAQRNRKDEFSSYKGLVMCGYQGWFSTPEDGSERGWAHLGKGYFKPGSCNIDLWPDVSEYTKLYKTDFQNSDGSFASIFSSRDESTTDLHFKWMKQYGIDGVFMQRFIAELKRSKGKLHFDHVLDNAMNASKKYGRAIVIMYDLSGMRSGDEQILLKDIDDLSQKYNLFGRKKFLNYLFHNGKPLVSVWGVGFKDHRAYGLHEAELIVNALKQKGFSVMIGVPTYWRDLTKDTGSDPALHALIKKCDIVMPWFVGRYNESTYDNFKKIIPQDIAWCKGNKVDYVPLVFPGFSWKNMKGINTDQIPRNKGSFFWKQLYGAISYGSEMMYVAMFDEMDEGTAIFKCTNNVPVGESKFCDMDGKPSDFYLWLTGQASEMLKHKIPLSSTIPDRK